ncbi:MAG TPA: LysE family transporter [Pilimelia sp.]|nr:LysE family transporter [Pilimelia sp.]
MLPVYLSGLLLGLALIAPIGPQNVFIVGQGLAVGMPRALWAVLAAGFCDSLLIVAGAAGVSGIISAVPVVRLVLLAGGAVFLGYLGVQGLRSRGSRLEGLDAKPVAPRQVIAGTVTVSLLNPHAILDTVGVIGAAVAAQPADSRMLFAGGTLSASWLWFLFLAAAAAMLRRRLTPRATVWFDRASGLVMLFFAVLFSVEFARAVTG